MMKDLSDRDDMFKLYTDSETLNPYEAFLSAPMYSTDPDQDQTYKAIMFAPVYSAAGKMLNTRNKYGGQIDKNRGHELFSS